MSKVFLFHVFDHFSTILWTHLHLHNCKYLFHEIGLWQTGLDRSHHCWTLGFQPHVSFHYSSLLHRTRQRGKNTVHNHEFSHQWKNLDIFHLCYNDSLPNHFSFNFKVRLHINHHCCRWFYICCREGRFFRFLRNRIPHFLRLL